MKKLVYLISFIAIPSILFAQKNGSVKGILYDSVAKHPIASATITLLQQKDSSLISFTMTDDQGRFMIDKIANGKYRLLITHVNYHNRSEQFVIDDSTHQKELGQLYLSDLSQTLEAVVVTAEAPPVTLLGDTVQYNAGSFKVAPNANVEQLLKKMPGVKVEKDGSITAQGEKVKKVLVDGKEFFGNDPKLATRNLSADAVDKVQVYDKKSEQAELTGFDDGNSQKTINLKLKKDKTKGMFGKVTAGSGTDDRYQGRFNLNSFQGARRLSILGMANNINADGFSFSDIMGATGMRTVSSSGGGAVVVVESGGSGGSGGGGNSGNIRTIWGTGLNYNDLIGKSTDFSANYFFNNYNPVTRTESNRTNFLNDSTWLYKQNSVTDNLNKSHKLNMVADIKLDSFHSIRIAPQLSTQDTRNTASRDFETLTKDGSLINEGSNRNFDHTKGYTFQNDILFRKKFRRAGRTFSLNLQTNFNGSNGDGTLQSINSFYKPAGSFLRKDSMNQRNESSADVKGYQARAVYTEPLFRRSLLEFTVSNGYSRSSSSRTTWDIDSKLNQEVINKDYTNDYSTSYGSTDAGVKFRSKGKKYEYSIGTSWQQARLSGKIIAGVKDSLLQKSFYNFLPNASFKYNFKQMHSLNFNYRTTTVQPTASQLQPVPDNSDPLNIREGNPDLKQELKHSVSLNVMAINPYKARSLFFYISAWYSNNKIVDSDTLLEGGIRSTKPVNTDGVYSIAGALNTSLPLNFFKGAIRVGSNFTFNNNKQFLNRKENRVRSFAMGPDVKLDLSFTDKFDMQFSAGINFNNVRYALRPELNNKYFSQEYGTEANWELPKKFYLSSEFSYVVNNRLADGFNLRVPLWNASVSKHFLKNDRGELKLSAFDLLNKNVDISRNASRNYIEDVRSTVLKRYFMLTFTYSLNKTGGGAESGPGIRIINR
ncbi:outer membrane beta-barrel protein [Pseudoflavitalea sp. G-6-1-2]|uniref:outer membrane beta-barrel protein n=1 Tax=Pseudoflavitalea sp. G-6-1-2 TaxID=2728841 RepID=UPI00146BDC94|nr:outer membrane beta-barrel protein [Pseudoflavitalea sp. G-6-1-2]NML20053.1 outer membrane beta-barrel protein [Pseudoflavitalea sp. G-6-1-2]